MSNISCNNLSSTFAITAFWPITMISHLPVPVVLVSLCSSDWFTFKGMIASANRNFSSEKFTFLFFDIQFSLISNNLSS
eukprot:gene7792-15941_t